MYIYLVIFRVKYRTSLIALIHLLLSQLDKMSESYKGKEKYEEPPRTFHQAGESSNPQEKDIIETEEDEEIFKTEGDEEIEGEEELAKNRKR